MTAVVTVNPATGERLAEYPVHLLRRAREFDVVVAENMFGDILSDLAGELAGSLGIAASVNASEDRVMAQAAHGSAPVRVEEGVRAAVSAGVSTRDLGGTASTDAFTDAVVARIAAGRISTD